MISHVIESDVPLTQLEQAAEGSGSGDYRVHEINPSLGSELRALVIDTAKRFDIPWHLLERGAPNREAAAGRNSRRRFRRVSAGRGWYVIESSGRQMIAALVDAKGSCSCRLFDVSTGHFLRKLPNQRGSFRVAFAHVIKEGREFRPASPAGFGRNRKIGLARRVIGRSQVDN